MGSMGAMSGMAPVGGYGTPIVGGYGTPMVGGYGTPMAGGYGTPMTGGYGAPMVPAGRMGYGQQPMAYGVPVGYHSGGYSSC